MRSEAMKLALKVLALVACMAALLVAMAPKATAQPNKVAVTQTYAAGDRPLDPAEVSATQERLLSLLKVSPTLASVVASDPGLLADEAYVSKSNPELAEFLKQHPEVGRNPGFYLFSDLRVAGHKHYDLMEPKQGFESRRNFDTRTPGERLVSEAGPFLALLLFGAGFVWLIRTIIENRRWGKIFKLQSDVHNQLMSKFGSSQELMAYMETDAGRRFLEAAPIATESDQRRMPNIVSRVLLTTQVGVVLSLLGSGLLFLQNKVGDAGTTMLVLGILVLMPGIGFMISAAITWELAKRMKMMPAGDSQAVEQQ